MESKELFQRSLDWAALWIVLNSLSFATHASELLYSTAEESKPGTIVGHLTKDLGMDVHAILLREMRIISETNAKYFDVDLTSGALVVIQTMDRESMCGGSLRCHTRIQISLQNPLEMHSVTVEIVDVNDNAPHFPSRNTSLEISEAAAPGTIFRLESAHDPDVGVNSLRAYFLSQNDRFMLKVETKSDGSKFPILVLNKPLDREKTSEFKLILTAVDGGSPEKSGNIAILIKVLDVNDNAPNFHNPTKRITLLENSPHETLVTTLNASDADHGQNGEISYMFDKYTADNVLKLFSVDSSTGEIRVTGLVDHELADMYDVTVLARDKGIPPMEGSCNIKIEIVDLNDNTPAISINVVSPAISENVSPGTVIALIKVKDEDTGKNGDVSVHIPYGLPFKMSSPYEGLFTLMTEGLLDREAVAEYTITVTATDSGSRPRSSQESFVLRLSDVNDNPPVFSQPSYSVDIDENNAPNAPLLSVSASDPDVGENSTIYFSILESEALGGSVSSYVYINPDSGQIYAMRKFDYEQLNAFQIIVQVLDRGTPTQSSNTTVHVFIIDQNDHPPVLIYPAPPPDGTLQFLVPSTAGIGHLVNRITFVDGDSGHNAWLFYSFSGLDAEMFHIGAHTGELRTARRLTEEDSKSVFSFTVIVKDNGRPSLSSSVVVNITLAEKASDVSSERRSSTSKTTKGSDLTLYLIITLSFVITVSFLVIIFVVARWLSHHGYAMCLMQKLGFKHTPREHQHNDLHLQLNTDGPVRYMEVVGASRDFNNHTYTHGFSTISSRSDFVFVKAPQSTLSMRLSKRLFAHSLMKQKPPNADWRFPPNQRPGPSGQHRFHTLQQRWTPYEKSRAGAHPGEAGAGAGVIAGTGPWPNPPTEAEQLQALMAAANVASEATATLGPRYNPQYGPDFRQNVYIPGSTATLTANPQQQVPQQALPPPQALPPVEAPKAAQTPASKKKPTKKDKK
ncbi:protocadherin gamma-C5-like isoform X9 [Puntigrus tetrazona]|uniref:protocadherin gamma-C5-like isoform X9 n=1 Tax=Puntigrus tetrazona TaxID=1606681 RepID=UPI001C899DBD|nr:protocadherin gamma-C5-like isoform X9 [Puntigrus tetrazona]